MEQPGQRRTRNPWPIGIIVFFAFFICATAAFVLFSAFHGVDLVSADYYERELRYQDQVDRLARTQSIQAEVRAEYDAGTSRITLTVPQDHARRQPTGQIHLYRPSAAQLDRHLDLDVDPAGRQVVDLAGLAAGLWRVRVTWTVEGQEYYWALVITNRGG